MNKRGSISLLATLSILYIWDTVGTVLVTGGDPEGELNPFMAWILSEYGTSGFITSKLTVLILCLPFLYIGLRMRRWMTYVMVFLIAIYSFAAGLHIFFLVI